MNTDVEMKSLSVRDRWKRYWYLGRVDTWLWTMPGRRRKQILAELKQNLALAAMDQGMDAAIDDLGRPRVLASQYLEGEPKQGPVWAYGAIAAVTVFAIWLYATMIYVFGALDALAAASVENSVQISFLQVRIVAEHTPETIRAVFSGFSWITLGAMAIVFLLFSRIWRLKRPRLVA